MEGLPGQLFVAIGAVVAALIAGAFSYFNLVTSKESKVSEFRQQWINALRQEIATYTSRVRTAVGLLEHIEANNVQETPELLRERSQLGVEARAAYDAIHLRINKDERNEEAKRLNNEFIAALENTQERLAELSERDELTHLRLSLEELIDKSAPVLKHEWKRVRDGERSYRYAKSIALVTMIAALVLLLAAAAYLVRCVKAAAVAVRPQPSISEPLRFQLAAPSSCRPFSLLSEGETFKGDQGRAPAIH